MCFLHFLGITAFGCCILIHPNPTKYLPKKGHIYNSRLFNRLISDKSTQNDFAIYNGMLSLDFIHWKMQSLSSI